MDKLVTLLIIMFGILNTGEPVIARENKTISNKVKIILYQKGKQSILDNQSPYFQELLDECERLLKTADTTYRLSVTEGLIVEVKKKDALEIIYPQVETVIIPFNQQTLYFSRLLIPLNEKFANGTVFFAGVYEYELKRVNPDLSKRYEYNFVDVYRAFNFVRNTQGISKLKESLQRRDIKID